MTEGFKIAVLDPAGAPRLVHGVPEFECPLEAGKFSMHRHTVRSRIDTFMFPNLGIARDPRSYSPYPQNPRMRHWPS